MSRLLTRFSKLVVLSYIIDWAVIIATALVGYAFSKVTPNHNPFSLADLSISYPYQANETVTTGTLALVAVMAPAVIILVGSFLLVPGAAVEGNGSRSQMWRRKLWEWNAGWLGLGVALAGAFLTVQGLKDLIGKPRPDFLARCDPDLSKIKTYTVSGLGTELSGAPTLVTWEICRNKTSMVKGDGFASFPSGHACFSFAGMTYLTLWLCSKLQIAFPYLPYYSSRPGYLSKTEADTQSNSLPRSSSSAWRLAIRSQGAAPPVYMLIVALVPLGTASFIAASRWYNHRHHGFDILFGTALGIFFAWIGFKWYHLPIRRGAGWSWGARSRKNAFFKAVGFPSPVGDDNWSSRGGVRQPEDIENGDAIPGLAQSSGTRGVDI
ncbi:hypothetical protein ASPZODRAFT_986182 [Penicilliopsis zonata CBS 506.65]|uniref:Phosphatidic acid phosphatase type 2/haloperoxidase domain-containing protein n=1 Tax=Penicilliopsis zonata CBS 506.65 TaxID=1073090 RepID=A0A1L9SRA9_9EURO|nr:hypothetical protein ASPZODRAFT_986182 [Penicilliopsis zonata CBS 506.65]OJJ49621.1 hypothetical protein ASPZODRAFT_986182 [Penicilliopsis zonata CBS 506.65]